MLSKTCLACGLLAGSFQLSIEMLAIVTCHQGCVDIGARRLTVCGGLLESLSRMKGSTKY